MILAVQELRLHRVPAKRLTAHLCASAAPAVGEPPPPMHRSEAFVISGLRAPVELGLKVTTARALTLTLDAHPAVESLLGEISAARLQQAALVALDHGAPALMAVPMSDSATGAIRGEVTSHPPPPQPTPPAHSAER